MTPASDIKADGLRFIRHFHVRTLTDGSKAQGEVPIMKRRHEKDVEKNGKEKLIGQYAAPSVEFNSKFNQEALSALHGPLGPQEQAEMKWPKF